MATENLKHSLEENSKGYNEGSKCKKLCTIETASEIDLSEDKTFCKGKVDEKQMYLVKATEEDVGISEYVSNLPGFYAIMKERYSDFLVNEIDLQGNLIKLTSMEKPPDIQGHFNITELLDDETIKKLQDLKDGKGCKEVSIEVTDKEKSVRKTIHEALRENFEGIESNTVENSDKKIIIVRKQDAKSKGRRFKPSHSGNYIHFVLYKENRDTMDAVNTISSFLRISSKAFSYAGTKDKRGKTSQLISAYRLSPDKLLNVNKKFNMIKVGNIVYKNAQIKLGDLKGNNFIIILRQVNGSYELIQKAVNSLATKGFINYYGMQRFGTSYVSTHSVGRALLLGDWKSAIDLILRPRLEEDKSLSESRKIWLETNNAKKAFENLKYKSSIEGKLLGGLASSSENDLVNALNAIPRNTRLMYIHSYQSFIWNKVVSHRIKKHGLKVLVGDLILKSLDGIKENTETERMDMSRKSSLCNSVKHVSAEDMENISISDIVFPLPGHSVVYPKNETKDYYETFLKEDGMTWTNFESKVKTYSLSGAYRKMIVTPEDIRWEIIPYDDVSKPLALSDLDVLQRLTLADIPSTGAFKGMKIEFKLPPSSYATMAVREILKCNTSYSCKKTE